MQTTAALMLRGDSLYYAAEYDSARAAYERLASSGETASDSAVIARAITALGLVAWKQGRLDDAKTIGERALALKQRLGLKPDLAKSYNALGLLAQTQGALEEAVRRYAGARAAAEAVADSVSIAKIRGNLGLVYQSLGDFERARTEFAAFREVARAVGDVRSEMNAVNNLGMTATGVGDPTEAIRWLTIARDQYEKINSPVGLENALGQLGVAYAARGESARALAYLDSALTIARKHGLLEPETDDLEMMAEIYEEAGDHRRALEVLERARILCDSLKMTTRAGHVALTESRVYAALGNLTVAKARAREAAARQSTAGARMDELNALVSEAELAQRDGDRGGARGTLEAAARVAAALDHATARIKLALGKARVADAGNDPGTVIAVLRLNAQDASLLSAEERAETEALRARAYFRLKRLDLAADEGRRAVASFEILRANLGTGALRSSYAAKRVDVYSDLVITLLAIGRPDEAFRVADAARGRGLIEHLGAAAGEIGGEGPARDAAAARALLRKIDALVERLRSTDSIRPRVRGARANTETGAVAQQLREARREYERMIDRLAGFDPAGALLGATTVGGADIRGSLGVDEALLEFLSTETHLLTFIVRRDRVQWIEVPLGRSELAERVHLARELIAARDTSATAPLTDLYAKVIAPVEGTGLLRGITTLLLVPHGALTYLPFAALRTKDSAGVRHYLVERYALGGLPSASALPALRARASRDSIPGQASIFAPLPSELPATLDEGTAVARQLGGARLTIGAAATEAEVRASLERSGVVHVASHGVLNSESPMFSSIRLSSPRALGHPEDNGRLETHEVLGVRVRSALVFLSGCETALGPSWATSYARGDDYATLAQAFLFAGAGNVVATLWRIDDRRGAMFAARFYQALESARPANALATAQRAFIADPAQALPYYWAAYALTGSGELRRPR